MSIYVISDLHISVDGQKPMDIFGGNWTGHMEKLKQNWISLVGPDDTVLMPGDFCWAMDLKEAAGDFAWLSALPGKKVLSKGNHDYWWQTMAKLNKFLMDNNYQDIAFLYNNAILAEGWAVCGTRGWLSPGDEGFGPEDARVYAREIERLRRSANEAQKLPGREKGLMAILHYPPFDARGGATPLTNVIRDAGASHCFYGHLHGAGGRRTLPMEMDGVLYQLVAADSLNFVPMRLELSGDLVYNTKFE